MKKKDNEIFLNRKDKIINLIILISSFYFLYKKMENFMLFVVILIIIITTYMFLFNIEWLFIWNDETKEISNQKIGSD